MQTSDTINWAIEYANAHGAQIVGLSGRVNGYDPADRRSRKEWWHAVHHGDAIVWRSPGIPDVASALFVLTRCGRVSVWYVAGSHPDGRVFLREAGAAVMEEWPRGMVYALTVAEDRKFPGLAFDVDAGRYSRVVSEATRDFARVLGVFVD